MRADPAIYRSERIAESYARFRPPLHPLICARFMEHISSSSRLRSALDVGCGAGASTAALAAHADTVVGLDPYSAMLRFATTNVVTARFVQGRFEFLPFKDASFQLVSTAGAINYTDVASSLAEAARVLAPGGWFVAYDFSAGARLSFDSQLPARFAQFRRAYPSPPGYALDLSAMPYAEAGLALRSYDEFSLAVPMSADRYVQYLLGESGVEAALGAGARELDVRLYIEKAFVPLFENVEREVVFDVQIALAKSLRVDELTL